jgi:hypothetical protein
MAFMERSVGVWRLDFHIDLGLSWYEELSEAPAWQSMGLRLFMIIVDCISFN